MICESKNTAVPRAQVERNPTSSTLACALSVFGPIVPESTTVSRPAEDVENPQSFDIYPKASGHSWSSMAAGIDQRLDCLSLGPPVPAIEEESSNSLSRFENESREKHSEIDIGEIRRDPEDLTQSNSPRFGGLPAEIRQEVWKLALTAEGKKFDFSDVTELNFKPNVATGLLRVNHEVYHDAFNFLYTENQFIFRDCGSGIKALAQPRGLIACRANNCTAVVDGPSFKDVTLVLGDSKSIDKGEVKMQHFAAALEDIHCQFKIENLKIYFRDCCWASQNGPADLIKGLHKLQVTQTMKMFGADFHWSENLRVIPKALGMNISPDNWCFAPGAEVVHFRGFFSCSYRPATKPEELDDIEGRFILDAGYAYNEHLIKIGWL